MAENWFEFIDWIDKHSGVTAVITTIVSAFVIWMWNSFQEKIKIKIQLKVEGFKTSRNDDEALEFLKFRIKILNHSKGPVGIQDYYLRLPDELANATHKFGLVALPAILNGVSVHEIEGVRMYANYFHLTQDNGDRMKLPISIDSPVTYLYGELDDQVLLKNLRGKRVRFVAFDQHGKEHFSNHCNLTDKGIIQDMQTR